jgi:hypothetical protein
MFKRIHSCLLFGLFGWSGAEFGVLAIGSAFCSSGHDLSGVKRGGELGRTDAPEPVASRGGLVGRLVRRSVGGKAQNGLEEWKWNGNVQSARGRRRIINEAHMRRHVLLRRSPSEHNLLKLSVLPIENQ